jgi:hypothetical protein
MGKVDGFIRQFEPLDTHEKIDALVETLKSNGIALDDAIGLTIRFKIAKQNVLRYFLAKYFGLTTGEKVIPYNRFKSNHKKKIYYGCKEQEDYIKKQKEERRKRLKTTNEEWRKHKHNLPIVENNTNEGVVYTERTKIIFTPMGGMNKRH